MVLEEDKIKEYCGIFGISCSDYSFSVANSLYSGLMAIQHRGQLFSGISTTNCIGKIFSYKNFGLVSKVFNVKRLRTFTGNVGIGHVAFDSPENNSIENAQPYHYKSGLMEFSLALNGAITNHQEIKKRLSKMGKVFIGDSDVELISTLIETLSRFSNTILDTLNLLIKTIKGAYSIILLTKDGNLYVLRDPVGYKPLCHGIIEENNRKFFIISSESCAIDTVGGILKGDIKPGEIFHINPMNGITKYNTELTENKRICQYEYVYFARPDSIIEGISVADVRYRLGINLAQGDLDFNSNNSIVVPVPDSGRSAAMGYSWQSKIPYQEGLMKNRYLWQLKSDPNDKLNPIKPIVNGKNVILVDDSMLSGITMKKIIMMLRKAGARAIHVRIACPPIINNCQINNSFSNRNLLIAYQKKKKNNKDFIEVIQEYIKADSLKFQTVENLINSIGINKNNICYNCLQDAIQDKKEKAKREIEAII